MSVAHDQDWRLLAACRDMDPAIFFPNPPERVAIRAAQAVCRQCPVRAECEAHAWARPELAGVWGGRWMGGRAARRHLGIYASATKAPR